MTAGWAAVVVATLATAAHAAELSAAAGDNVRRTGWHLTRLTTRLKLR